MPAQACRLALVLAIDISSSVDRDEDALQRNGLAAALIAEDVQAAFFASPEPVAVLAFEWSGQYNQRDLIPWTMINTPADLTALSDAIGNSRRSQYDFATAMGFALAHAANRLRDGPDCLFRTIDMAGDGENNEGFSPAQAYATFPFDGVTVNGLVVNGADFEGETQLVPFFRDQVIRGPGSFIEIAQGFGDYQNAMERKLIRELAAMIVGQADGGSGSKG